MILWDVYLDVFINEYLNSEVSPICRAHYKIGTLFEVPYFKNLPTTDLPLDVLEIVRWLIWNYSCLIICIKFIISG